MRFVALTISVDNKIPSYKDGIMKEIKDWFVSNDYFITLVRDIKTTPQGFYLFETKNSKLDLSLDDCEKFFERYKKDKVKYKLTALEDVFELEIRLCF